jgi:ketosteroid isomerase-like protein
MPSRPESRPVVDALDVAARLFTAIEAGDVRAVGELYAPDVEIWHNTDGMAQGRDANLATLRWLTTHLPDARYTRVRRCATADGFVQQHVFVATNHAGQRVEVPACIVATVHDGRITRLDEYLDSTHVDALTARMR